MHGTFLVGGARAGAISRPCSGAPCSSPPPSPCWSVADISPNGTMPPTFLLLSRTLSPRRSSCSAGGAGCGDDRRRDTKGKRGNGSGLALSSLGVRPLRSKDFLVMGVSAILNALQLLTSTKALAYVAVSTPVVFRTASVLLCAGIETTYFGRKFPLRAHAALVVIFWDAGVRSADFNVGATGCTWLLGNTAAYTANNI